MQQATITKNNEKEANMFLAHDGSLINVSLVTTVSKKIEDNEILVRFWFVGGNARELIFLKEKDANIQIQEFLTHVEQPELFDLFIKHF